MLSAVDPSSRYESLKKPHASQAWSAYVQCERIRCVCSSASRSSQFSDPRASESNPNLFGASRQDDESAHSIHSRDARVSKYWQHTRQSGGGADADWVGAPQSAPRTRNRQIGQDLQHQHAQSGSRRPLSRKPRQDDDDGRQYGFRVFQPVSNLGREVVGVH